MDGGRMRKWRAGRREGEMKGQRVGGKEGRRDRQWEERLGREGRSPGCCSLLP